MVALREVVFTRLDYVDGKLGELVAEKELYYYTYVTLRLLH